MMPSIIIFRQSTQKMSENGRRLNATNEENKSTSLLVASAYATAALLAAAPPAFAQSAADCKTVEVKWTVPEYAVNGHFTLNVAAKEIVNPWSDDRTAMIRGKVKKLEVDGNQIAFTTSELHEVTITVDENCTVTALSGTGESRDEGPYDIMLGKE